MREQIENRLRALNAEFKTGQEMLVELSAKEANLRTTLARISGAIQVLEELLEQESGADRAADAAAASVATAA